MKRLALLLLAALPLYAEIQPSFNLESCAWKATAIVLATEGETIDGQFDVVRVWKGDLRPGDRIRLEEMSRFADPGERTIAESWFQDHERVKPEAVTCNRVVLFLGTGDAPHLAAAWIEDGRVYAFRQEMNPGPTELMPLGASSAGFERDVRAIVGVQRRFRDALERRDDKTIHALMHEDDSVIVRHAIVTELGERGAASTRVLLDILDDDELAYIHQFAIPALVKAAGRDAIPHIVRILGRELVWFRNRNDPHDEHYGTVYTGFATLHRMFAAEGREIAEEWLAYWKTLPQAEGIDQIPNTLRDYLRDIP